MKKTQSLLETNHQLRVSAIIVARDSQHVIEDCLRSVDWADERVVIDNGSTDKTIETAKKFDTRVFKVSGGSWDDWHNIGAEKARGEWLLYVDTDERITPLLKKEILATIDNPSCAAYSLPRRNILLGHEMKWGGWWPDRVVRLMKKASLTKWVGTLHERPEIKGEIGELKEAMVHITHRSLSEMLEKTNKWSVLEAKLLLDSGHPPVVWWRFISIALREFWFRAIRKLGFLDGTVGVIEIIYQMFSRMITYAKLWEMQINAGKKNLK